MTLGGGGNSRQKRREVGAGGSSNGARTVSEPTIDDVHCMGVQFSSLSIPSGSVTPSAMMDAKMSPSPESFS